MKPLKAFFREESGQAVIEFLLLLLVTIAIVSTLKTSVKKTTAKFWSYLAKKIAAPCPSCDAGSDFDL